jgi:hypothetical protein
VELDFEGHAAQLPDPALYVPATHWHIALPEEDSDLTGHVTHAAVPTERLNVPAKHALHGPPSAPVNPAEHWHSALPEEEFALAGHVSHTAVSTALLNVPATHALHATPSKAAVYPGTHLQSVSSLLSAAELECEGQAAQLPDPAAALYVPAKHATHAPPSAPVNPAWHWHSTLPEEDSVLTGHVSHGEFPTTRLNVPATHALHGPPSAPVNPAEHWHSALPEEEFALAGHVSHVAFPTALLNVPATHALHATPSSGRVELGKAAE